MMYRRGEAMCYLSCSSLVTLPHLNDPLLPPGSCRNSECWCFVFISLLSFILQINCSTLLRPFHAHTHKHTQLAHKKLCILFDILSPLIITFLPRVSFSLSVLAVIRERLLQSSEQRILLFFSSLVQLRCSGHFVHRFLCKWLSLIHALLVASEGDLLYYCFAIWYRPQGTWGDDEGSATISTGYLLSTLHNGDIRTNRRKKVTKKGFSVLACFIFNLWHAFDELFNGITHTSSSINRAWSLLWASWLVYKSNEPHRQFAEKGVWRRGVRRKLEVNWNIGNWSRTETNRRYKRLASSQ